MSRYQSQKDNLQIAYGYDHALGYWYDLWDTNQTESDGTPLHIEEGSSMRRMSRDAFASRLMEFPISPDHLHAIALDLPF